MNKKLIWLMGGMASGKSTLRRALCTVLATSEPKLISNDKVEYTDFGNIACVGKCLKDDGCDGLDSSFGRLKKEGGLNSTRECLKLRDIVILEGSQTSSQWIQPLVDMCKEMNVDFYVVSLDCRYWANFLLLKQRIEKRGGSERDITDKRIDSVMRKINQFRGVFNKLTPFANCLKIDTEGVELEEKVVKVLQFIRMME